MNDNVLDFTKRSKDPEAPTWVIEYILSTEKMRTVTVTGFYLLQQGAHGSSIIISNKQPPLVNSSDALFILPNDRVINIYQADKVTIH